MRFYSLKQSICSKIYCLYFNMEFITRVATTDYALPFDGRGISRLSKGKIKLQIVKCTDLEGGYCSAGLYGEKAKQGTYTFYVSGRLDWMDPSVVFAIWTYADSNKDELDLIETSRWGDLNNPNLYYVGFREQGVPAGDAHFLSRAFNKHKFTLTIGPKTFRVLSEGQFNDGTWKVVADFTGSLEKIKDLGEIRVALWVPKKGFTFKDVASRGTLAVTLDKVEYVAPTLTTPVN